MGESEQADAFAEIQARFFRWSLKDWEREIDAGYPWLRTFTSPVQAQLREALAGMTREQALSMGHSLVRRTHRATLARLGGNLDADAANLERHRAISDAAMLRPWKERPEGIPPRDLANALKAHFGDRFGELDARSGRGREWRYSLRTGDWIISTAFDAGGRPRHLLYQHDITTADGKKVLERTALLHWLGVSGQTGWDIDGKSGLPDLCRLVDEICGHFLAAAPAWLAGIR